MFLLASFLFLAYASEPTPPQSIPSQYTSIGVLTLPYGRGIFEPIACYYDTANSRVKMDYFNGQDTFLYDYKQNGFNHMIIPEVDRKKCVSSPSDPTQPMITMIPDISTWAFVGYGKIRSQNVLLFQNNVTTLGYLNSYTMSLTANNRPVQLIMQGFDFLYGSHPDTYILDYYFYQPLVQDLDFTVPALCNNSKVDIRAGVRAKAALDILTAMGGGNPLPRDAFGRFAAKHNKVYKTAAELKKGYNLWKKTTMLIEEHNSKNDYTLKENKFADWEFETFKYIMLPNSLKEGGRPTPNEQNIHPEPTEEELANLPASVDWRDHGCVTPIKDQGVCGSCWTFGSIGSLEGVWAKKYGKLYSLSEQQIVDCAWGDGESGCDGGFAGPAYEWIASNGGVSLEADYPYIMVDGWCNPSFKAPSVRVKSFNSIATGSESGLQHAVATVGPVSVAIDAAHDEFEYYADGVYYNPDCKNGPNDLDHEVLVVGYGTENGADYWIVKNSWSTNWGKDGYIKMARNRSNNCGIATQASYPVV